MKTFEIVDGTIKGNAFAVVDVSFDINLHDLDCSLEGEALDAEDFLDIIKDNIEEHAQRYIEAVFSAYTHFDLGGSVCIEDCTQSKMMEIEIEAEVETKDDE